jgi:TP901 family phage tail tape measure protein
MASVGLGIAAVGVAGLAFFASATKAAITYRQESALTLTQVTAVGAKLSDVMQIGINVANEIPVPFKEVQKSLYDIFSSGLNPTLAESERLLKNYAKAAVAGQTDIANVSRLTTGVMLAYKVPIQDVNQILDTQFRMVQLGVGNYEDFITTLGRAIGPAVAANQSFKTLAGSVAFLTENGLTAANASTSAGRAMELMAKPSVTAGLEAIGVKVRDSTGNFRQMNDIITDLAVNKGWAKMTGPDLAKAFQDTFGTGSIQARRFFDVAIPNFAKYNDVIGQMNASAGSTDHAYDIMLRQPQSQAQLLDNRWKILKTTIGEAVLPVFNRLLDIGEKIIGWFNGLSPHLRGQITMWGLIGSALAVVVGVGMVVGGMFLTLASSVMAAFGVALLPAIGIIAGVVAGFVALVAIVILVIKYHKEIIDWYHKHEVLVKAIGVALLYLIGIMFPWVTVLAAVVAAVIVAIKYHKQLGEAWNWLWQVGKTVIDFLAGKWNWLYSNAIKPVIDWIMKEVKYLTDWWNSHFQEIATVTESVWAAIGTWIKVWWDIIWGTIKVGLDILRAAWTVAWGIIKDQFTMVWNIIKDVVSGAWQVVSHVIDAGIKFITGIIGIGLDLITGHWGKAWKDFVGMVSAIWNDLWAAVQGLIGMVVKTITDGVVGFGTLLWDAGQNLIKGMIGGIKSVIKDVIGAVTDVGGSIVSGVKHFFHIGSPSLLMHQYGQWIVEGLINGIGAKSPDAQKAINGLVAMPNRSPFALQGAGLAAGMANGKYIHLEIHAGAFAPQVGAGGDAAMIAGALKKPMQDDFVDVLIQQLRTKV